jgi:Tfp pilus assembly protein PilX
MNRRPAFYRHRRHAGMVLPTVLVMLLILTVASLVMVEQISSQTRMAGNAAASQQSLQVAEATLRNAIGLLVTGTYKETDFRANAKGLYFYRPSDYSKTALPHWSNAADWATAQAQAKIDSVNDATTERKFMIEQLPQVQSPGGSKQTPYRITARVVGQDGHAVVMLQTIYKL